MKKINSKLGRGLACAVIAAGLSNTGWSQTNAPAPAISGENPAGFWEVQLTGDYFYYDARYTPNLANSGSYLESGSLYGGTFSVKAPFMNPSDSLDVSFRVGRLNGNVPVYSASTGILDGFASDKTDLTEIQGLFRLGIVNRQKEDPKFKMDLLIGVDYQGWKSVETEPSSFGNYIESGTHSVTSHQDTYLIDFGLGANWFWWTHWNETHNTRLRLGVRGEGVLGGGVSYFDNGYAPEQHTDAAIKATGRAVLYTDYKFGDWTAVLEGGYQYTEFWFINSNDTTTTTSSQSLYGPYVRVGIGYAF